MRFATIQEAFDAIVSNVTLPGEQVVVDFSGLNGGEQFPTLDDVEDGSIRCKRKAAVR
jgi:hypothetical protein